jgi:transcriptional antiterminator RfaH
MTDANVEAPAAYWATVQFQPHRERVAEHFLRLFGFEVYLPCVRRYQTRWRRRIERLTPLFPGYCFTRIELQWHGVKQAPGVIRVVRGDSDEPARIPNEIIAAIRSRERDGALDLPTRRGPRAPKVGDRIKIIVGPFVGHSGVCAEVTQQRVEVLLFVFGAQRGLKLRRSAIEVV